MKNVKIIFRTYKKGKIKSINFEEDGVVTEGTGAVLPGRHYLGEAKGCEKIVVTFGWLIINGKKYTPEIDPVTGKPTQCIIKPGEKITIETQVKSLYNCF